LKYHAIKTLSIILSCCIVIIFSNFYAQSDVDPSKPDLTKAPIGYPVTMMDEKLFDVYDRIGPFTPEDRAKAITLRLSKILHDTTISIDEIMVSPGEVSSDITMGDLVIMTVTDGDAKAVSKTHQQLANEYAQILHDKLESVLTSTNSKSIVIAVVLSLAATAGLIIILSLLRSGFHRLQRVLRSWHGKRIKPLKIHDFELLTVDRVILIVSILARLILLIIGLILIYLYFPFILNLFPWTKPLAGKLNGFLLSVFNSVWGGFISYLPDILIIIISAAVAFGIIRLARLLFSEIEKGSIRPPRFHKEWAQPTFEIVRILIIVITIMVAYPHITGLDSIFFKGLLIFLGIIFCLGSFSAMSNIIAGVSVVYMHPFNIGDRVKIANEIGEIIEQSILVTRIRTIKNVEVIIPNSTVFKNQILNYSSLIRRGLNPILNIAVNISKDVPSEKANEILLDSCIYINSISKTPPPFTLQTGLSDSLATSELNVYTDKPDAIEQIYSELFQNIQKKFKEANIEVLILEIKGKQN
jgi:small-conductance mechanosensitive channel